MAGSVADDLFDFGIVEKVLGAIFGLILLFLLLDRANAANQILGTLGQQSNNIFKTLQGR